MSNIDIGRDDFALGLPAFSTDGEIGRFEYTGSYKPSTAMALVFGLDFQDEELLDGETIRSRDQKGYYFEYQGGFKDAFYVSLGARYDDNDDFGTHSSTRATAAYVQDLGRERSLKYRASLGSGFRAPSLYEIAYNAGPFAFPPAAAVELEEETSAGYDLGIEYDAAFGLHLEVTYFDQKIEDEIFFDPVNFSGYLQSSGKSTSKGIEIAADVPLRENWGFIANWTNNDTEDSANQQRLQRPKNVANFGLAYTPADGRLNLIANYRLSRDSMDVGGVALDDYEVLDLAATFDLGYFELHARIENVTDESYQEVSGYNTAGRSVYAGVRVVF
jgi:vitamin B12 transporter